MALSEKQKVRQAFVLIEMLFVAAKAIGKEMGLDGILPDTELQSLKETILAKATPLLNFVAKEMKLSLPNGTVMEKIREVHAFQVKVMQTLVAKCNGTAGSGGKFSSLPEDSNIVVLHQQIMWLGEKYKELQQQVPGVYDFPTSAPLAVAAPAPAQAGPAAKPKSGGEGGGKDDGKGAASAEPVPASGGGNNEGRATMGDALGDQLKSLRDSLPSGKGEEVVH
ncbi:MAG: hypothetical protein Q7N87_01840 [Candidatus Uhrbacteria bacterium]|nr:hypothetical protein [Candidatus Uhrbacteria bacterium]